MVDADGATQASEVLNCLKKLKQVEKGGLGIAIGSRAHLEEQSKAQVCFQQYTGMEKMRIVYQFVRFVFNFPAKCVQKVFNVGIPYFSDDASRRGP